MVIGCPYDGPAGLQLTEKTHLLSTNEKKSFVSGREDRAARMYPRIPIDRREPSFQIGSTHMGTETTDLQV